MFILFPLPLALRVSEEVQRSDQPNQPIRHQDLGFKGSERWVTHLCVSQLCIISVWPAVWHTARILPTALSSFTPAPMADLPTVVISSPHAAFLTELHSRAKKSLTSVCSCIANCFLFSSRHCFSHAPPKSTFLDDPHPSAMEGCRR